MKIIFTLCSNNYLAQAKVLAASVRQHQPEWKFVVGLVDKKTQNIDYDTLGFELVEASVVEPGMLQLAEKYSIIELNTCVKPAFFIYFFDNLHAQKVVYMDPDTRLYNPMMDLENCFVVGDIILTPHIISPIPLDQETPGEKLFLNYGLYNLGFLAVKKTRTSERFLHWWKERTYTLGYDRPADGLFTDQLWINLVPVYFRRVKILRHLGYNMAPWNLHERSLEEQDGTFQVFPGIPLIFFHFSGFDPGKDKIHKDYSRFQPHQRPDLKNIYEDYRRRLNEEGYAFYTPLPCYYKEVRNEYVEGQKKIAMEKQAAYLASQPLSIRWLRRIKRSIPIKLKKATHRLIKI